MKNLNDKNKKLIIQKIKEADGYNKVAEAAADYLYHTAGISRRNSQSVRKMLIKGDKTAKWERETSLDGEEYYTKDYSFPDVEGVLESVLANIFHDKDEEPEIFVWEVSHDEETWAEGDETSLTVAMRKADQEAKKLITKLKKNMGV